MFQINSQLTLDKPLQFTSVDVTGCLKKEESIRRHELIHTS